MRYQRYGLALLWLCLLNLALFSTRSYAVEPEISAISGILVDAGSGEILWSKDPDRPLPIASTTKIMTALLALENCDLNDQIMITSEVEAVGEEEASLRAGEMRSVSDLLYAMMVKSANDAATALAKHTAGSTGTFVAMMNAKAKLIGTRNTHFANPNGLHAPDHFSTAADLALISRHALKNREFAKICATKRYGLDWRGYDFAGFIVNRNRLLSTYPEAIGIKTGYTRPAGYCLVGAARRQDLVLISVLLNEPNSEKCFSESQALLEYGFSMCSKLPIIRKGEVLEQIRIDGSKNRLAAMAADDLIVLLPQQASRDFRTSIRFRRGLKAPVEAGAVVGTAMVSSGASELGRVDLVAADDVDRISLPGQLLTFLQDLIRDPSASGR